MKLLLSVAIRIPLIGIVLFYGFWVGIPVAMGFDAGYSAGALLIASAYLITFVPAALLLMSPISVIFHPPLLVRIWYWWVALLGFVWVGAWLFFTTTILSKGAIDRMDRFLFKDKYGTVCWKLKDDDPSHYANIGLGYTTAMQFAARPTMNCHTFKIIGGRFKLFYGGGIQAALDVPIKGAGKTCVELSPLYKESSQQVTAWSAKVIDCALTIHSNGPSQ